MEGRLVSVDGEKKEEGGNTCLYTNSPADLAGLVGGSSLIE